MNGNIVEVDDVNNRRIRAAYGKILRALQVNLHIVNKSTTSYYATCGAISAYWALDGLGSVRLQNRDNALNKTSLTEKVNSKWIRNVTLYFAQLP